MEKLRREIERMKREIASLDHEINYSVTVSAALRAELRRIASGDHKFDRSTSRGPSQEVTAEVNSVDYRYNVKTKSNSHYYVRGMDQRPNGWGEDARHTVEAYDRLATILRFQRSTYRSDLHNMESFLEKLLFSPISDTDPSALDQRVLEAYPYILIEPDILHKFQDPDPLDDIKDLFPDVSEARDRRRFQITNFIDAMRLDEWGWKHVGFLNENLPPRFAELLRRSVNKSFPSLLEHKDSHFIPIQPGSHVAVMINGLGSISSLELMVVKETILLVEQKYGLHVDRVYTGCFMSSLHLVGMTGFSISVMVVDGGRLQLLDAATEAPYWPGGEYVCAPLPRAVSSENEEDGRSDGDDSGHL